MMATGTATLDFGAFPGSLHATAAVTGQTGLASDSLVEAWVWPTPTADHTADEHLVDPPRVVAGSVVPGTGFTLYGFSTDTRPHHGIWSVAWVWA